MPGASGRQERGRGDCPSLAPLRRAKRASSTVPVWSAGGFRSSCSSNPGRRADGFSTRLLPVPERPSSLPDRCLPGHSLEVAFAQGCRCSRRRSLWERRRIRPFSTSPALALETLKHQAPNRAVIPGHELDPGPAGHLWKIDATEEDARHKVHDLIPEGLPVAEQPVLGLAESSWPVAVCPGAANLFFRLVGRQTLGEIGGLEGLEVEPMFRPVSRPSRCKRSYSGVAG